MRVLWFSVNPALYAYSGNTHGGWISALQREVQKVDDLQLAIAFPWRYDFKEQQGTCLYYGMKPIKYPILCYVAKQKKQIERMKEIIEDYQPDVIHVFGTEKGFGLVSKLTNVPVVTHLQGLLNVCYETYLPQNMSWRDYIIANPRAYLAYNAWHKFMVRERDVFRCCKYYMGRTEWDKAMTLLFAPDAHYYHCDEMLRPEILQAEAWQYHKSDTFIIVSVVSGAPYKGTDVILRTAQVLKDLTNMDFIWKVYGVQDLKFAERLTGYKADGVNVHVEGRVTSSQLIRNLQDASVYVHPSYVENSSNAICEAQYVGLPVIATNVGGTATLMEHNQTGILVPANDIYSLAAQIMNVANDADIAKSLGAAARKVAILRHNPQRIISQLINVYNEIQ